MFAPFAAGGNFSTRRPNSNAAHPYETNAPVLEGKKAPIERLAKKVKSLFHGEKAKDLPSLFAYRGAGRHEDGLDWHVDDFRNRLDEVKLLAALEEAMWMAWLNSSWDLIDTEVNRYIIRVTYVGDPNREAMSIYNDIDAAEGRSRFAIRKHLRRIDRLGGQGSTTACKIAGFQVQLDFYEEQVLREEDLVERVMFE